MKSGSSLMGSELWLTKAETISAANPIRDARRVCRNRSFTSGTAISTTLSAIIELQLGGASANAPEAPMFQKLGGSHSRVEQSAGPVTTVCWSTGDSLFN